MPSHLSLGLLSGLLPSGFPSETLYVRLLYLICATCPAHLGHLDLITRIILTSKIHDNSLSITATCFGYLHVAMIKLTTKITS